MKHRGRPRIHQQLPIVQKWIELSEQSGMSWEQIAKISGYDRSTLYRWRNAGNPPPVWKLEDVLNAIGYRLSIEKIPTQLRVVANNDQHIPKKKINNVRVINGEIVGFEWVDTELP